MAMNSNTKTSREDVFRELPVPSALRAMILPAVTSQLIVLIYNMADTFYVGQTNNPYMMRGPPSFCRSSTSPCAWPAWRVSAAGP